MSLFTNEEFGHLAIRLNECRCPICKRIAEKICDDHKGINPYEQRIKDVIEELEEYRAKSNIPEFDYSMSSASHEKNGMYIAYSVAISLLKNGVK